jgi:hypothetical protein
MLIAGIDVVAGPATAHGLVISLVARLSHGINEFFSLGVPTAALGTLDQAVVPAAPDKESESHPYKKYCKEAKILERESRFHSSPISRCITIR